MPEIEFILQGLSTRTHGAAVRELFNVKKIESVVLSISFITEDGVKQIESELKAAAKTLRIFAGIRNDITSHQALARLRGLGGLLYTVDTGSRHVVFHPKVFLVRGMSEARAIVGSANLTLGGMNNNVEAGLLLSFDLLDPADKGVVEALEKAFDNLLKEYPDNVAKVGSGNDLDALLEKGRIVDELAIAPPRLTASAEVKGFSDSIPRIKLKVTPIYGTKKNAFVATKKSKAPKPPASPSKGVPTPPGVGFELVWESAPLTRRDLTIPTATGTNQTGSINLDKGLLEDGIDFRHYFREEVFPQLKWTVRSGTVDEANAQFLLVLKGINYGEVTLAIRHTNSTDTRSYQQHNAMTRLSWGPLRDYIAKADFIGRTLGLYRDKADPTRFLLQID